ncbi:WecB/TagA/CpsF family glycosyltransferase [Microbacterium sp. GXF7504]
MRDLTTVTIGAVPFVLASSDSAKALLLDSARRREGVSVRLANAYCVTLAQSDLAYAHLLKSDGVNFADGVPVAALMSRRTSQKDRRKYLVRGPSLFRDVVEQTELRGLFVGARAETLEQIRVKMRARGRERNFAGSIAPPFGPITPELIDEVVARATADCADVVWVGMGTPKQDFLTSELARRLSVPCVGVGAAFDFYAGTVREAPSWLRGSGLEWLYRLLREPRRLGRRYLVGNVQFLWAVRGGR